MLGIDSKRDIITGEFARKIFREVITMWNGNKEADLVDNTSKYKVEWE